jgi:hypothetical protein
MSIRILQKFDECRCVLGYSIITGKVLFIGEEYITIEEVLTRKPLDLNKSSIKKITVDGKEVKFSEDIYGYKNIG